MDFGRSRPSPVWFEELYERHFEFVWRTLRHLGVRHMDLPDACQDAFIVVHRRYPSFEQRGKVTSWLFRICFNVARDRRRRAYARYEVLDDEAVERSDTRARDLFAEHEREDKLALFEAALDSMDLEQRATFILFEVEGMSGPEVAETLGVPLGTAYSRLRLAREAFERNVLRVRRAEASLLPGKRRVR